MAVQVVDLLLGLDPLGDHLHARFAAKGDGGIQHAALEIVGAYGVDEHLVDLDLADAEALQVGETAITCAEVIQLEVIPLLLELRYLPHGRLDIGDRLALGQLEGESGRGGPVVALQQGAQIGLLQVGGHYVDADPLGRLEPGQIRDDPLQQLLRHGQDQPLLLRIVDEGARRHQLPASLPAQQRLETDHFFAATVHYGLIEGDELAPHQGCLQQSLEGAAIAAQHPVGGDQQEPQCAAIPEAIVAGLPLRILLQRLARPQGLPDVGVWRKETQALAALVLLDGAVPTGKWLRDAVRVLLAKLEIETARAGRLQQIVAPAVVQHPVGDIAALPEIGDQLLLCVEAGLGGREAKLLRFGVGGQRDGGEGKILPQTGTAATGGEDEALQSDVAAVETGIPQQGHVCGAAIEGEVGQLGANALVQLIVALRQRGLYLRLLLLQQMVGQGIAQQLAEGQARQHGQAEQQQTDPEGRRSSQGVPA